MLTILLVCVHIFHDEITFKMMTGKKTIRGKGVILV